MVSFTINELRVMIWRYLLIYVSPIIKANPSAIIRKYHLDMCRQCFRERAFDIGFIKVCNSYLDSIMLYLMIISLFDNSADRFSTILVAFCIKPFIISYNE